MIIETFSRLPLHEQSRIVEMAWEDRTPFEAIELQFGFSEKDVIRIMQQQLKVIPESYLLNSRVQENIASI